MLGTLEPEGHLPPNDGADMLSGVQDWLKDADLTFANLEGPLCDEGTSSKCKKVRTCYAFRSPTRYAKYLEAAGIDLASTANNHAGDFGDACRRATEATLDAHHIAWSGARGSIGSVESNGLKVALIGFHTSPGVNDVNDIPEAVTLVKRAAAKHDLVVVSFHGGGEGLGKHHVEPGVEKYLGENRGNLRAFAHAVVDAGADLVLGHGPHVLRGMEVYQERLVAYSLGNFATYGRFDLHGALGVGAVLEVQLDAEGRFLTGKLLPTRQEGRGVPQKDEAGRALAIVRDWSKKDFPSTGVRVDAAGVISH